MNYNMQVYEMHDEYGRERCCESSCVTTCEGWLDKLLNMLICK